MTRCNHLLDAVGGILVYTGESTVRLSNAVDDKALNCSTQDREQARGSEHVVLI
jgi:hypothetical protein